jgi:uracil-DNA glycosylase family 4
VAAAVAAGTESLAARPDLDGLKQRASACVSCRLAETRTQVVFGSGSPTARLMFVGEAPGFHEDAQGVPFVGAAGKLLAQLLGEIGLQREDVYIANVLKCRPPANRDPQPDEIEACQPWLFQQIEQIRPLVVATLGNFATKLLSGSPDGITRVHGVARDVTVGSTRVKLFPVYHPAAALYARALLAVLEDDFRKLPTLLAREAGEPEPEALPAGSSAAALVASAVSAAPAASAGAPADDAAQLGLF